MSTPASSFETLSNIPIDRILPLVMEKLQRSTLDELGALLGGRGTAVPTPDDLAKMILALPEKGSKFHVVQNAVVLHAVAASGGNVSAAARLLGIERKAFERKLARARRSKRG